MRSNGSSENIVQLYSNRKHSCRDSPLFFPARKKCCVQRCVDKKKMQSMYTVEYYSAMNRNINMESVHRWVDLEKIILSRIIQAQKYKHIYPSFKSFALCVFRTQRKQSQAIRKLLDCWLAFLVPEDVLTVASGENTSVILTSAEPQLVR